LSCLETSFKRVGLHYIELSASLITGKALAVVERRKIGPTGQGVTKFG
jgi:hypothetical protein